MLVRVLGIDPGYAIVGWGVLDYQGNRFQPAGFGAVTTKAGVPLERRLAQVYDGVAEARGVILLAAAQRGVPIFEYTPMQVKQSVSGYGMANKKQVQEMTRILLHLDKVPKPDDTADALAMAITHCHCSRSRIQGLPIR